MCGRFSLASLPETLAEQFGLDRVPAGLMPRYNIAPGQMVAIIRHVQGIGRHLDQVRWGLIPSWAEDSRIGHRLINARAESVAQKPAFRSAFRKRRCLIPADGFYEWREASDGKQPYWISPADGAPFAFAGLWEHWESTQSGEVIESCTIITTGADAQIRPLHERMPVILPPQGYAEWLAAETTTGRLQALLGQETPVLRLWPVSRQVNSPLKENPQLIEPLKVTGGTG